jgi:hypothetical protein
LAKKQRAEKGCSDARIHSIDNCRTKYCNPTTYFFSSIIHDCPPSLPPVIEYILTANDPLLTHRRGASKRGSVSCSKTLLKPCTSSIHAKCGGTEGAEEKNQIERLDVKMFLEETSLPSAPVGPGINPRTASHGDGIILLLRKDGIFLDLDTHVQDGGEGIGKLHDAHGRNHSRDVGELRNGRRNDESSRPVDWNHDTPEDLAPLLGERRTIEEILNKVLVDDFDTDVPIKASSNDTGDEIESVGSGLPVVRRESLVGWVEGELSLLGVDDESKDQVAKVDENLGT